MSKPKLFATLLAAGLFAATPAFAQSRSPSNAPDPRSTYADRHPNLGGEFERNYDSRILLENKGGIDRYELAMDVAQCLARSAPEAGDLVGGTMSEDPRYEKLARTLGRRYGHCVSKDAVGSSMMLINGALAETLIKRSEHEFEDKAMPRDIVAAQNFYLRREGPTLETIGRCMAVFSPGLAIKALSTKPGSDAETSALSKLFGGTPECGVAATPSDVPAAAQRSAVAAGLYHWLMLKGNVRS